MKIECKIDSSLSSEVRESAAEKAERKLNRFTDAIDHVTITLKDINGPKGGLDMQCVVIVKMLNSHSDVIITETAEVAGKALSNALNRAVRVVGEHTNKKSKHERDSVRTAEVL